MVGGYLVNCVLSGLQSIQWYLYDVSIYGAVADRDINLKSVLHCIQ